MAEDINSEKSLMPKSRLLFYIFSVLVFFLVVYYFSEIRQEFRLLKKVRSHWLLLALVFQLLTYFINALIYRLLLKAYEIPTSPKLKDLYKISVISLFFNQTLPSAGISGNAFIFNYLQRKEISSSLILSVIFAELLSFYAAMEFVILVFAFAFLIKGFPAVFDGVLIAGLLVYLFFGTAIVLTGRKKSFDFLYKKLGGIRLLKTSFEKMHTELLSKDVNVDSAQLYSLLKNKKKEVAKAFVFQLLLFVLDVLTITALFYGLGVQVSLIFISLAYIATKIVSILPFSPGALILYESSMTFFFVQLGIDLAPSIIVTLVFRLLSFWLPIPIGLIFYRQWIHRKPVR